MNICWKIVCFGLAQTALVALALRAAVQEQVDPGGQAQRGDAPGGVVPGDALHAQIVGDDAARRDHAGKLLEVLLEGEYRSRQDDQIGRPDRGSQVADHPGCNPKGLGPPPGRGAVTVANDRNAGHALTHSQRDRTAKKPQSNDGNLP